MATTMTSKGQVTIPKQIRDADFFIGAHAAVAGLSLLTRDVKR